MRPMTRFILINRGPQVIDEICVSCSAATSRGTDLLGVNTLAERRPVNTRGLTEVAFPSASAPRGRGCSTSPPHLAAGRAGHAHSLRARIVPDRPVKARTAN